MKKLKITLIILTILSLNITLIAQSSKNINRTTSEIDHLLDSVLMAYEIPAMVAAVVKSDTIYFGYSGVSKLNETIKVNLKSKFHLGSNTKAITSFIAMKMIENNQISLETKLFDLIPELKEGSREDYFKITLGNLLSHRAKIRPYTSDKEHAKLPEINGDISEKRMKFVQFVLSQKPARKEYSYSNAGYVVAALMLEKAAGKSYEELLDETFSELKLDYFIGWPNKENIENPWGHCTEWSKELKALPPDHFYGLSDYMAPCGDISMNIVDYAQFIQLNLKGLIGKDNYLKSDSYNKLHFGLNEYSYGWANYSIKNSYYNKTYKASNHDGSAGTFFCSTAILPYRDIAVIVISNAAEKTHRSGVYLLQRMLYGKYRSQNIFAEN